MNHYINILTIKSKTHGEQVEIISKTVSLLAGSADLRQLRQLTAEQLTQVDEMSDAEIITLWILVTYAADIGTVPHKPSRDAHLMNLGELALKYDLSKTVLVKLTIHGDFALRWFDDQLAKVS